MTNRNIFSLLLKQLPSKSNMLCQKKSPVVKFMPPWSQWWNQVCEFINHSIFCWIKWQKLDKTGKFFVESGFHCCCSCFFLIIYLLIFLQCDKLFLWESREGRKWICLLWYFFYDHLFPFHLILSKYWCLSGC